MQVVVKLTDLNMMANQIGRGPKQILRITGMPLNYIIQLCQLIYNALFKAP